MTCTQDNVIDFKAWFTRHSFTSCCKLVNQRHTNLTNALVWLLAGELMSDEYYMGTKKGTLKNVSAQFCTNFKFRVFPRKLIVTKTQFILMIIEACSVKPYNNNEKSPNKLMKKFRFVGRLL